MKEKIANSIVQHQMTINELNEIKNNIEQSIDTDVEFNIKTKHLIGYDVMGILKKKKKLSISNYSMSLIIDGLVKKEKERIDKLIDMEIERRMKSKQ